MYMFDELWMGSESYGGYLGETKPWGHDSPYIEVFEVWELVGCATHPNCVKSIFIIPPEYLWIGFKESLQETMCLLVFYHQI